MKIGVSCYSFKRELDRGMTYFEACDHARRMGYEGIEFIDLNLKHGQGETTIEALARSIKGKCDAIGLPIVAYTVHADFLSGTGCDAKDEPARVMRCADIAYIWGAGILRHDAFWNLADCKDWQTAVEKIAPAMRMVSEYARTLGIKTCTENHGYIMQDSARMVEMMRAVDCDNYGWLVDMGNFLCADENPAFAVGIAAPYAFHVHAKDFLFKTGENPNPGSGWMTSRSGNYLRGTVVGHGVVPIKTCLASLKRAGYDGYLSVEFEGAEEVLPALENAQKYLRQLV